MISDILGGNEDKQTRHLVLGLPSGFDAGLFKRISDSVNLYDYSIKKWSIKDSRISVLLLIFFIGLRKAYKRTMGAFKRNLDCGNVALPALLMVQEDQLSMDRSFRGQPHWVCRDVPPPSFRTLIFKSNSAIYGNPNHNELKDFQIYSLSKDLIYSFSGKHPVQKRINSSIQVLLSEAIYGHGLPANCLFMLAILFLKSSLLSAFCIDQNVKAFMTCENYFLDADAMNLIGPKMGIQTFSYQYSNMSEIGPIMMSTADTLFTFSELFHKRFSNNSIKPNSFYDIGYPYDSSFSLVKKRAEKLRKQLVNNGSQFTISYFDESVQDDKDKYGMVSSNNNYKEVLELAKLVLKEKTISVIIKTQFWKNSPSVLYNMDTIIEAALATGRFIELLNGKHRNSVFPAEASLASDLVISHAIGGTAGLEVALAGGRSILLNPYSMQGANIELFKQADILYDNINIALNVISLFRQGKPEYKDLGDWSPIISKLTIGMVSLPQG